MLGSLTMNEGRGPTYQKSPENQVTPTICYQQGIRSRFQFSSVGAGRGSGQSCSSRVCRRWRDAKDCSSKQVVTTKYEECIQQRHLVQLLKPNLIHPVWDSDCSIEYITAFGTLLGSMPLIEGRGPIYQKPLGKLRTR